MATIQYQLAVGADRGAVATSTPSTFGNDVVRVQVDFTSMTNRTLLLETLEKIAQRIQEGPWPPA